MCKCQAFLQAYADWLTKKPHGLFATYGVSFTLVTNMGGDAQATAPDNPVGYGSGSLTLNPAGTIFTGTGSLFFNTSLWGPPGSLLGLNPFNPNATHPFTITIVIQTGQVTFSDPQSNVNETANLRCANGMMYGFSNSSSATPRAFLIGFTTSFFITPK